jgi:cytochrome P450 family 6
MYFQVCFQYWKKRNVPCKPPSFPMGTFKALVSSKSVCQLTDELYKETKGHRYFGTYFMCKPQLMIFDLELVKTIMVSEFMSFHDRGVHINEDVDPLAGKLNIKR